MGTTIPGKVAGSPAAEAEAKRQGFRDYDQMRAWVLAKQNGGTTAIKGAASSAPKAPVSAPAPNAMADSGIMGYLNRKMREATGK